MIRGRHHFLVLGIRRWINSPVPSFHRQCAWCSQGGEGNLFTPCCDHWGQSRTRNFGQGFGVRVHPIDSELLSSEASRIDLDSPSTPLLPLTPSDPPRAALENLNCRLSWHRKRAAVLGCRSFMWW